MKQCIFCIENSKKGSSGVSSERILKEYKYWWLILQPEEKRKKTKQAAGLLILKRHLDSVSDVNVKEISEFVSVLKEASRRLCEVVNAKYSDQETVGFNQGTEAGQTIMHAHIHILPVSESDPDALKIRAGIGGAFEALREKRLGE